jgi:dCMP deaminase
VHLDRRPGDRALELRAEPAQAGDAVFDKSPCPLELRLGLDRLAPSLVGQFLCGCRPREIAGRLGPFSRKSVGGLGVRLVPRRPQARALLQRVPCSSYRLDRGRFGGSLLHGNDERLGRGAIVAVRPREPRGRGRASESSQAGASDQSEAPYHSVFARRSSCDHAPRNSNGVAAVVNLGAACACARLGASVPQMTSSSQPSKAAGRVRASWDEYFMNIAREVSTRSTCDRKFVGAVIVRDKSILATGYNGSVRGLPHCDEDGHLMEDGHCVRTVHAEANAIVQAARHGVRIEGASIYVTASPCWGCFRLIANAGISRIGFGEFYRDQRIFEVATRLGIELVDMSTLVKKEL